MLRLGRLLEHMMDIVYDDGITCSLPKDEMYDD